MDKNTSMMNALQINQRAHGFDGYNIRGICYQLQDGSRCWTINVNFESDRVSQAWCVSGDGFRCIGPTRHLLTPPLTREHMLVEPVPDIEPLLKKSVLDAIQKWGSEPVCCALQ